MIDFPPFGKSQEPKVAYDLGIIDKPKIYYVRYTGNKFNNKQAALADIKRYNSDIVYRYKSKQARFDRKNPIKNGISIS